MGGKGLSEPKQAAWLVSAGKPLLRHMCGSTEQNGPRSAGLHRTHRVERLVCTDRVHWRRCVWFSSFSERWLPNNEVQEGGFDFELGEMGFAVLQETNDLAWPSPEPSGWNGLNGWVSPAAGAAENVASWLRKRGFVTAKTWLCDRENVALWPWKCGFLTASWEWKNNQDQGGYRCVIPGLAGQVKKGKISVK